MATSSVSSLSSSLTSASSKALWAGRILSGLPALFLLVDAVAKFARPEPVVKSTLELGFSEAAIVPLGVVLLVSTLLYVVPRTALVGAILLTGYLGGAVSIHVREGNPLFTHVLMPVYFGVMLWAGLTLRRPGLRALVFGEGSGGG